MSELQFLRYSLIEFIVQTTDVEKLRFLYREAEQQNSLPALNIPVAEIKSGVSLEEIMAEQTVQKIDAVEFRKRINEEEWDQSLEELLAAFD